MAFKLDEWRRGWILSEGFAAGGPPEKPARGQAPPLAFYRRVLARHDELMASGVRNSSAVLAEEMDENEQTVRSWIKRGRRYLRQGGEL